LRRLKIDEASAVSALMRVTRVVSSGHSLGVIETWKAKPGE
jgi:hypothetical protein